MIVIYSKIKTLYIISSQFVQKQIMLTRLNIQIWYKCISGFYKIQRSTIHMKFYKIQRVCRSTFISQ